MVCYHSLHELATTTLTFDLKAEFIRRVLQTIDGKYTAMIGDTIDLPKRKPSGGKLLCPRCLYGFTRRTNLKEHFIKCVRDNGNPDSLSHNSHESWSLKV